MFYNETIITIRDLLYGTVCEQAEVEICHTK